jgi:hypothetical protein
MVLEPHVAALTTLRSAAFHEQLGRALRLLHEAERIVVFGTGPLAALAQYAATLLSRAGRHSMCLDATEIMLAGRMMDPRFGDALLALGPWPGLSRGEPNRPLSHRMLGHYRFHILETFLEAGAETSLFHEGMPARPPDTMHGSNRS